MDMNSASTPPRPRPAAAPDSLLMQLPALVEQGRRQARDILARLDRPDRARLHTQEVVGAAKDTAGAGLNRLVCGDNLLALAALLAGDEHTPSLRGQVQLIYIDPPFGSQADYTARIALPADAPGGPPVYIDQFAYADTWRDGTAAYLAMLVPRLILMRELLADNGSLYVHLDWRVGPCVKLVLDEVFGEAAFFNEIIWHYPDKLQGYIRGLARNHDTLYAYRMSRRAVWNGVRLPLDAPRKINRRVWNPQTGKLDSAHDSEGRALYNHYTTKNADDVWRIPQAEVTRNPHNTGYATEKPETLLARIIGASSDAGQLVADFNGGSGTTAAVAEKMGRRWISVDLGATACRITRQRLAALDSGPFLYQTIGLSPLAAARAWLGADLRVAGLSRQVLSAFGATPCGGDALGRTGELLAPSGRRTLVWVDSPLAVTDARSVAQAASRRARGLHRWDDLVVLAWQVAPGLAPLLAAQPDGRMDVLRIPHDLQDRLRQRTKVRKGQRPLGFQSLACISLHPLQALPGPVHPPPGPSSPAVQTLCIALKHYTLLSPEALDLDAANRDKLLAVMRRDPLALIDHWAVDPDYDGRVFRAAWQSGRGRDPSTPPSGAGERGSGRPRVPTTACVVLPARAGPRQVCVRTVDVLGIEAEVVKVLAG